MGMVWRWLLFAWIAAATIAAFVYAPLVPLLEGTTRVLYWHIPAAWITVLALGWSMLQSAVYLWKRDLRHDDHAASAAELGLLFCIGATVSGALWAKAMWGAYWNWDPRQTSIFFVLLIYGAYLAIRGSIDDPAKRARLSAIYSLAAFVAVPFLIFVVPRLYFSLHPDPILNNRGKVEMDPRIRIVFGAMVVGFTFLFAWLQSLKVRTLRLERRHQGL